MHQALILDFDGTILDTEWPHFAAVRDLFGRHDVELTLEQWQHRVGAHPGLHWFDWLDGLLDYPLDASERERTRTQKTVQTLAQPALPGAARLMHQASSAGHPLAVASSSPSEWVEGNLERLGLLTFVDHVRTRDHVENTKPEPDVFLAAADALEVDPALCVAVEDSRNGVLAAKAAGMTCVAVPNQVTAGHDFSPADAVLGSLAEFSIEDWIRNPND